MDTSYREQEERERRYMEDQDRRYIEEQNRRYREQQERRQPPPKVRRVPEAILTFTQDFSKLQRLQKKKLPNNQLRI
jgi:hypothetical protein